MKRTKVILICVSSLDGKIAKDAQDSVDWTSSADRKFFAQETKKAGVVLMGRATHLAIGKVLPERLNVVFTSQAKKFKNDPGSLEYTSQKPKSVLKALAKRGYQRVMLIGGPSLNDSFLREGLIDEIWLTVESLILGKGIGLFGENNHLIRTKILSFDKLGESGILIKYRIVKK